MKVLLDSCINQGIKRYFQESGYDVEWCGDWQNDPGDQRILQYAYQQKQILVTLDKDFGELAIVKRIPHCGILRLVNLSFKEQVEIGLRILNRHGNELLAGGIITAKQNRIRIRPAEEP